MYGVFQIRQQHTTDIFNSGDELIIVIHTSAMEPSLVRGSDGNVFSKKILHRKSLSPFFWSLDTRPERLDRVWQTVDDWIEDEPDLAVLYNLRGFIVHVRDKDKENANEAFNKALQLHPYNLVALASLMFVNKHSKHKKAGIVEHLGKLSTSDIEKEKIHAKYEQGFICARFGVTYYQKAERLLKQTIKVENNIIYLRELVHVMSRRIKRKTLPGHSISYKDAPSYFEKLTSYLLYLINYDDEKIASHYSILGEVLSYSQIYYNCERWRNKFYQVHPDKTDKQCLVTGCDLSPDRYNLERLAHYYQCSGRKDDAIDIYKLIIENHPSKCAFAHNHLGKLIVPVLKFEILPIKESIIRAVHHFQKAIELNPMNIDARIWLGRSLCAIQRHEEGLQHLEKAVDLATRASDDKDAVTARYHYCNALLDSDNFENGYREMEKVLSQCHQLTVHPDKWFRLRFDEMSVRNPGDLRPRQHRAKFEKILKKYQTCV
ncbi:uncharacterized protein LOC144359402 [Saccoglossus kowalevskii]